MKPAECRRLATEKSAADLAKAAEHLSEEREPHFDIVGDELGDKLTHVLLAQRIQERIQKGEDPKEAFRAVMAEVRAVVSND